MQITRSWDKRTPTLKINFQFKKKGSQTLQIISTGNFLVKGKTLFLLF